jgi:hypothetical protein
MTKHFANRRLVLKTGVVASSLFLPLPYAWVWGQSEGTIRLLKAPKIALVVGNGKYRDAPELKNPPNDARAIGESLKNAGFAVTIKLDAGREHLIGAIRDYVHAMEQKKSVGLFYFAGHGVQLAWRNYMLPIDAVIDKIEDMGRQSVDVERLMEGLAKAANPMNVIILDACRENPFGKDFRIERKGLSQMDAPIRTLLAYATSPGNVASDGEGSNGLYTENLLRELKVPEAKIEDVFKRVRLAVRLKSSGSQIPWESTSLEDDFWFLPPKELRTLSDAEKDKRFDEELALWEKVKDSRDAAALASFVEKYPSGNYAELAQVLLDGVLKSKGERRSETAADPGNPYSKGTERADTRYQIGDQYTFRILDSIGGFERRTYTTQVTDLNDREVVYDKGRRITDHLGNFIKSGRTGSIGTDVQYFVTEYSVGKRWTTQYRFVTTKGVVNNAEIHFKVLARENVTVPAGTFEAFKVQGEGYNLGSGTRIDYTYWVAPARVRHYLIMIFQERSRSGGYTRTDREELVAFEQKI